ncbi:hypothetical protein F3Y22_tig00112428pilonHSYRG00060 [Hibiscus syriacus]|uniref:Uncharacterized protein n=1 Tax=Hibiscus syriacus TaxID=106335 RepID=A0A6A2WYT9_HIBSY|nr:hypothetical protein F3Y22_tig00112428pilonHSYRG00060 [Hibiscus syriacus]
MLLSSFNGYFLTTKTTFVEWFIYKDGRPISTSSSVGINQKSLEYTLNFVIDKVQKMLHCYVEAIDWIDKSCINAEEYNPSLLVLRSIIVVSLLHLNFGKGLDLLVDLLVHEHITGLLPSEFCDAVWRYSLNFDINVLAYAFKKIGNPLAIVSIKGNCPKSECRDAIFVDMKLNPCREEILRMLFPKTGSS